MSPPIGGDLCPDCAVAPGVVHDEGCDVARCFATGEQRLVCGGEKHEHNGRWYGEHDGLCGRDVWTGEWPGAAECREYGFWCYWEPTVYQPDDPLGAMFPGRWIPCGPDHPDAEADLNRLVTECVWDREQQRFLLPY